MTPVRQFAQDRVSGLAISQPVLCAEHRAVQPEERCRYLPRVNATALRRGKRDRVTIDLRARQAERGPGHTGPYGTEQPGVGGDRDRANS